MSYPFTECTSVRVPASRRGRPLAAYLTPRRGARTVRFVVSRRLFLSGTLAATLMSGTTSAQRQDRVHRIGLLSPGPPGPPAPPGQAFRQGLRDLGYTEGNNLMFLIRFADGRSERLPALAAELVAENPDVIVVAGPGPIKAAKAATSTVPIVMLAGSSDPVAEGLVQSLARPGGNITGLTYAVSTERFGKQLEILKEAPPRLAILGILWDLDLDLFHRQWAPALDEAGSKLGIEILAPTQIRKADDLPGAFEVLTRQRVDAVLVASGGVAFNLRSRIAELALQHRMPALAAFRAFAEAGLVASYGPNIVELYRRGASFVDKILKGSKPAELPVEQPSTHELVLNLATARALGLTLPQTLLVRADRLID